MTLTELPLLPPSLPLPPPRCRRRRKKEVCPAQRKRHKKEKEEGGTGKLLRGGRVCDIIQSPTLSFPSPPPPPYVHTQKRRGRGRRTPPPLGAKKNFGAFAFAWENKDVVPPPPPAFAVSDKGGPPPMHPGKEDSALFHLLAQRRRPRVRTYTSTQRGGTEGSFSLPER